MLNTDTALPFQARFQEWRGADKSRLLTSDEEAGDGLRRSPSALHSQPIRIEGVRPCTTRLLPSRSGMARMGWKQVGALDGRVT